jgi:hypothetical protein
MRYWIPTALLLAAALVVGFGNKIKLPGIVTVSVADTTMLMVHERLAPPIDEVLAVREAPAFVEANKLSGFLVVDKDEPFALPLLEKAGEQKPPFIAFVKIDKATKKLDVVKLIPWPKKLEDVK